jgi:hypothetical protein
MWKVSKTASRNRTYRRLHSFALYVIQQVNEALHFIIFKGDV